MAEYVGVAKPVSSACCKSHSAKVGACRHGRLQLGAPIATSSSFMVGPVSHEQGVIPTTNSERDKVAKKRCVTLSLKRRYSSRRRSFGSMKVGPVPAE